MINKNLNIDLLRVSDILKEHFYVPSYQRGYRWSIKQVEDLLNDLKEFVRDRNGENKYYCLQPLVLKPLTKEETLEKGLSETDQWYEVIDGQQRITTIKILYSYFTKYHALFDTVEEWQSEMMHIEYETRKETGEFLDNLVNSNVSELENISQDIYHIKSAYLTIEKWFNNVDERLRKRLRNDIANTLMAMDEEDVANGNEGKPIKFIIYIDNETKNPIDIFERINIGKISLTNAELIRATFLLKSNYKEEGIVNNEVALIQKQLEIANEWDDIEHALQDDKFWYFLSPKDDYKSSRIGYIFDLIYRHEKNEMPKNNDDYQTFRFFSDLVKDNQKSVMELWDITKRYYYDLLDWFDDRELYHYIGWLTKVKSSDYVEILHNKYVDYKTIEEFKSYVKSEVKRGLGVSCTIIKNNGQIDSVEFSNLCYSNDSKMKKKLRHFYLLLNIQQTIISSSDVYNKFPFDLYENESWNIEHIDSHTENELINVVDQNTWIDTALSCLSEEQKGQYYLQANNVNSFNEKRNIIRTLCEEDLSENNEELKNSVGNLTLLDEKTNKSYGNQLFLAKRNIILKKEIDGTFILPATKYVFLKYFSNRPNGIKWGKQDIKDYSVYIYKILKEFLNLSEREDSVND